MKKKTPRLGFSIVVRIPMAETERGIAIQERNAIQESDTDGQSFYGVMAGMHGEHVAEVVLRRGMSPLVAAKILRKVASRIEQNSGLLNMTAFAAGSFNADGMFEGDGLGDADSEMPE